MGYIDERLLETNERYHKERHIEIDFLYKEVGILRCEMDLLSQQKREAQIKPYLEKLNINLEQSPQSEMRLAIDHKINNLEQALNLRTSFSTYFIS